jgi:hypothetical protein
MQILLTLVRIDRVVYRVVSEYAGPVSYAVLIGAFLVFVAAFIDSVTNQSHAYFLYPSNRCVQVESPDPMVSCDRLPERYVHHWVFNDVKR